MLHSASRLGILSYLYKQRYDLAYACGMIKEVPIAMCSIDHDLGSGLHIKAHETSDDSLPPAISCAPEIHLYYNEFPEFSLNPARLAALLQQPSGVVERKYNTPVLAIFHPPS